MIDPLFSSLAAAAATKLVKSVAARSVVGVLGPPEERALTTVLQKALMSGLDEATEDMEPDAAEAVKEIIEPWFNTGAVPGELLASVIELRSPDYQLLQGELAYHEGAKDLSVNVDALIARFTEVAKEELDTEIQRRDSALFNMVTTRRVALGLENQQSAQPGAQAAEHSRGELPRRPEHLFGREETLTDIIGNIGASDETGCRTIGVGGLPGVGKTSILAELCHRDEIRRIFPGGIAISTIGASTDLLSVLRRWSRSLGGPNLEDTKDVTEAGDRLRAFLDEQKVLIIVDDVQDARDAYVLKVLVRGAFLISSRAPQVLSQLTNSSADVYELGALSIEDSVDLIFREASLLEESDRPHVEDLADCLGGLPLFLKVAARVLENRKRLGLDLDGVVEKIRAGERLFEEEVPSDLLNLYGSQATTLHALLRTSLEELSEDAKEAFAALGAMAPAPATFDLLAAEVLWDSDEPDNLIEELVNRGLVQAEGEGRFSIHPVLTMWAKTLLDESPNKSATCAGHATHYRAVLKGARNQYFGGPESRMQAMRQLEEEWQNILQGWSWAKDNSDSNEEATRLCVGYPEAAGKWFQLWLSQPQQIEWAEAAIEASRRLGDKVAEANNLNRLAQGQFNGGDICNAIVTCQQALDLVVNDSSTQEDSIVEARVRGLLGAFYREIGQARDAEDMLRRQIALSEGEGQSDQAALSEAGGRGNLVPLLRDQGRYDEALQETAGAFDIYERIGDYYEAAGVRSNRGTIFYELRDYEASEREHLAYLSMALQMKNRGVETRAYANLGNVKLAKDEPEEGLRYYEEHLKLVKEQQLSKVDIGKATSCVARARAALGAEYDESFTFDNLLAKYKQALNLLRSGPVDPLLMGITLVEIAALHRDHGRATEGLEYAQEALNVFQELETPRNHADAWVAAATCQWESGERFGAKVDAKKALDLFEGIGHPEAEEVRAMLDEWECSEED